VKIKNFKIGTQLLIAFTLIVSLVVVMGIFTFTKTKELQMHTQYMYEHPHQVRLAVKSLDVANLNMRLSMRELMLSDSDNSKQEALERIALSEVEIDKQLRIIETQYLGPKSDIENLKSSYALWSMRFNENIELAMGGNVDQAYKNLDAEGIVGQNRDIMLADIDKIEVFATAKAESLYLESISLNKASNTQLIIIIATILILAMIIAYTLQRNINMPLREMNQAVKHFHNGALSSRSQYIFNNEFGELSESINKLADLVQSNMALAKKTSELSEVLLAENDATNFFNETLVTLSLHTGAQMAAVYVLSVDKQSFELFTSIGLNGKVKPSFNAGTYEGVFGSALMTRSVHHIKEIPTEEVVDFHTVHGEIRPQELLTIPITSADGVIAMISLATINHFAEGTLQYLDAVITTLGTRIEGVLAYMVIKSYKDELEAQNSELTMHKTELSAQTVELTQQNIELEMQKKQLNESSQLKTHFLSNMSHELRTPLNSVIALSSVLSRRLSNRIPEEEYSYLEIIERNGKNLLTLINDILDISRIEAGKEDVDLSNFDLSELIDDIVSQIMPQTALNNIGLIHSKVDETLTMYSDSGKCQHILQNLIGNAVKFTEVGKVEVHAERMDDQMIITVKDTGIGIASEHIPHIFDEFRQGDGSTSRRFHGTGLGLAIAKKYAAILGGSISVSSVQDQGSEFTLYLPVKYSGIYEDTHDLSFVASKGEYTDRSTNNSKRKHTILLVEDNESAVIQIKDLLEEMGNDVIVASNGKVALDSIGKVVPDAMILDLMMPEVDGFQVLETVRNADKTAHVPVLILTAKHITKEELKFLKRNNIHQLIQKGDIDRNNLQDAIAKMLVKQHDVVKASVKPDVKPVVLVIEDNPDNMITVKALLDDQFVVLEALDAVLGIQIAKEQRPNLILMDISLPGMSGIDAFKEIRKMPLLQNIPVIALTASAMLQEREAILSHGFDAFISKPILTKHFYEVINEVLYGN
jgi:signal transduction histidine kinase/DNA-binding response OmpR family regulator/HAMP domain-containing protein